VKHVLVIGAGVSGLTCGTLLAEHGYEVEIWAREHSPDTTSDVAAALWYPLRGELDERGNAWALASLLRFRELRADPSAGIFLRGGIELFAARPPDEGWWREEPRHRTARPDELRGGARAGIVWDLMPVIEMGTYLGFLERQLIDAGGRIGRRAARSLGEALAVADVVVNCAGLGARRFVPDPSMFAIRGQVVRVAQTGIERFTLYEEAPGGRAYVIPRARDVVCGGTREVGDERTEPDPQTARAILERCVALEPALDGAQILSHAVGLRPGRPSVRLEAELPQPGKLVVHDYGHAGSGVTLSWGCASEVLELVQKHA
jgi:D-amino-acid oxidase